MNQAKVRTRTGYSLTAITPASRRSAAATSRSAADNGPGARDSDLSLPITCSTAWLQSHKKHSDVAQKAKPALRSITQKCSTFSRLFFEDRECYACGNERSSNSFFSCPGSSTQCTTSASMPSCPRPSTARGSVVRKGVTNHVKTLVHLRSGPLFIPCRDQQ